VPPATTRVVAVAGIARPERFFDGLRQDGYQVLRGLAYADHHWFTAADVQQIERTARELDAAVVTTAKDGARLGRHAGALTLPWAILPLDVSIEPGAEFESWLLRRL
jgi:tetraacyldisaccharide 4'-kinase